MKVSSFGSKPIRGNLGRVPGLPEGAAQAECDQVFDKKVERASREMKRGFKPE
jgi:hypothetical protein